MATQTRARNCGKRRFEKIVEQTAKTFREIPANIFVRQTVRKKAIFPNYFLIQRASKIRAHAHGSTDMV
jgi:hypothetical protein